MALREDVVASAVAFLQDASVASSPIENRIAFLQSKNLTQAEVDSALARAGVETPSTSNFAKYGPEQHGPRYPQPGYSGYQQYQWQHPPPEVPRRDWRDWFIMATVVGGVGYGLYTAAKRYVYPIIAPPTVLQLEQDKQAIDESFEKAFSLLDQLAKDTESLKSSEQERTERLDTALLQVESVLSELKDASRRREEDYRRMNDEVRGLKDLIPRAIDKQKDAADTRLRELNTEMRSLKTLMSQRMTAPTQSIANAQKALGAIASTSPSSAGSIAAKGAATGNDSTAPANNGVGGESSGPLQGRSSSPFNTGPSSNRAAIPAWQMSAASKSLNSISTPNTDDSQQEADG